MFLKIFFHGIFGKAVEATITSALEKVIFGVLIIMFMMCETLGLAKLWQNFMDRMRDWPFRRYTRPCGAGRRHGPKSRRP